MPAKLLAWYRSTFGHALIGAALFWAAQPPLGWWFLAWIAPVWWVLLIRRPELPPQPPGPTSRPFRPRWWLLAAAILLACWMFTINYFHDRKYAGFWMAEIVFWPLALGLLVAATRIWRRPYTVLWFVGLAMWLAALHWLRLPHWATGFGWLAISLYFAFYLPAFIGLSRVAVHRLRVPVILAAPIVWTGLELARAHLLTGFTMGNLGHTQSRLVGLIQMSDLTGDYGVTFVVMFVAACIGRMAKGSGSEVQSTEYTVQSTYSSRPTPHLPLSFWPLIPAVCLLAAVLGYGYWRMSGEYTRSGPHVALIQGNIDTQMNSEEGFRQKAYHEYFDLSVQAIREFGQLDLMVWPESMYLKETEGPGDITLRGLLTCTLDAAVPEELRQNYPTITSAEFCKAFETGLGDLSRKAIANLAADLQKATGKETPPLILGVDQQQYGPSGPRSFNSAVYIGRDRKVCENVYSKMHLVMFGEYVPFAGYLPWLHRLTPLEDSATPGERAEVFDVGGHHAAANICYETVIPHFIRRQVHELRNRDAEPDFLVNLTNDGWFWGSSELKMHLACGVFRAVECRKPLLIAANTGISAWIDGDGRIRAEGAPHTTAVLLAEVRLDNRRSWYLDHGDWFSGICLAACVLFGVRGLITALRALLLPRQESSSRRPRLRFGLL